MLVVDYADSHQAGLDTVCRVTLEVLDQASDKIKAYFTSDVNILHDVMLHEDQTVRDCPLDPTWLT
jgi:hypothetical protein